MDINQSKGSINHFSAALRDKDILELQVTDDGVGMDETALNSLKSEIFARKDQAKMKNTRSFNGIGVQNVFQRME